MAENSNIWMPLYIGDYLGKTMELSTIEHGAYLLLLMAYWKNGGPISADNNRLAIICKMSSHEFSLIRPAIKGFFSEENGQWKNKRADLEIEKWSQYKENREFGAAVANFHKKGIPIPERYAERYAERSLERSPTPSPLPSSSQLPPSPEIKTQEGRKGRFAPPSPGEVAEYCSHRGNNIDPEAFVAFYQSVGWKIGNKPMKDWKSAVITWEKRQGKNGTDKKHPSKFESKSEAEWRKLRKNLGIEGTPSNSEESTRGLLPVLPPGSAGGG